MARNDLRARGGLGGGAKRPHQLGVGVARSATPTASNSIKPRVMEVELKVESFSLDRWSLVSNTLYGMYGKTGMNDEILRCQGIP